MALRDLVNSENCSEGNPISNFVNWVIEEKGNPQQESWRQRNFPTHSPNPDQQLIHPDQQLLDDTQEFEDFFEGKNDIFEGSSSTNISTPQYQAIHSNIHSFIHSSLNGQEGNLNALEGLSSTDVERLQTRADVLKRQIYPQFLPPESEFEQFNQVFNNLSIQDQPFLSTITTTTTTTSPSTWEDEFSTFQQISHSDDPSFADFEKIYQKSNTEETSNNWANEFSIQQNSNDSNIQDMVSNLSSIPDPKLQNSNFMNFIKNFDQNDTEKDWVSDFQEFQESKGPNWFWNDEESEDTWLNDFEGFQGFGGTSNETLKDYQFDSDNLYIGNPDALNIAKDMFSQGRLDSAVLAYEAYLHESPLDTQVWMDLGLAHAENDNDEKAIQALKKSIECNPMNLDAYLPLTASLTNETYKLEALQTLRNWLQIHPDYKDVLKSVEDGSDQFTTGECTFEFISEVLIQTALLRPDDPDPDVQIAMGILYNLSYEYDKAIDCFRTSLAKRPSDYLLWNKLGATLANSGRCQEALPAYYRALELKPSYQRAKSNLQISYQSIENQTSLGLNPIDLTPEPEIDGFW